VAYPPVLFLALAPLTFLPPPLAFLVWTLANLGLALVVLRGLAGRFAAPAIVVVAAVLGVYFPLEQALFVGQVNVLILFGLYRAYVDLERGHDLRAGLWAGLLLLKPQYAVGLGLVLLLKCRWRALAGLAIMGLALTMSSVALLGLDGLASYVSILGQYSGFRQVHPTTFPQGMVSWRGLLVDAAPTLGETDGLRLTTVLSLGTLAVLPLLWRGRWDPTDERFARRMLGTLLVTMLVSFHNHLSGATLLLVPGMAVAATRTGPRALHVLLGLGLVVPPFMYLLSGGQVAAVAHLFTMLMLATLGLVLADLNPGLTGRPAIRWSTPQRGRCARVLAAPEIRASAAE
jgi:hypothetical protein